jgi:hypothetical protein
VITARDELIRALDDARAAAAGGAVDPQSVAPLLLRILGAASRTAEVTSGLVDVAAARALLRVTDAGTAIEFSAGGGALHAEAAEVRGPGPKVDASAATWVGLIGGTLKPWLAFTRGLIVCRAGLTELRWMQTVAERLQRGYEEARRATG